MPPRAASNLLLLSSISHIVGKESVRNGFRYVLQLSDGTSARVAASQARIHYPILVETYERAQLPLPPPPAERAERKQEEKEEKEEKQSGREGAAGRGRIDPLLAAAQAQLREQEEVMATLRLQLAARSSPPDCPPPSSVDESASLFARHPPRASDLSGFDGSSGSKLDEWLKKLTLLTRLHGMNSRDTVLYATSRLDGAALEWWLELNSAQQHECGSFETLSAALRLRFQPITSASVARAQLDKLYQNSRHVNQYIADFQRVCAQIGSKLGEENALHAFMRGLHRSIAEPLRVNGVSTVKEAIAAAARIGELMSTSSGAVRDGVANSLHQMQLEESGEELSISTQIERAVLNALQAQQTQHTPTSNTRFSSGPSVHPQRSKLLGGARGRGGARGSTRFGGSVRPPPSVPGVSPDEVRRRWDKQLCLRCSEPGHRVLECGNSISVQSKN